MERTGCLLWLLGLASCTAEEVGSSTHLEILLSQTALANGESTQLSTILRYDDGRQADVSQRTVWQSDAPSIVTCDRRGWVQTHGVGRATITALAYGYSAIRDVEVLPARLVGLQLSQLAPYPLQVEGGRWYLHATALYTDGSANEVTHQATWSSSAPEVASVELRNAHLEVNALSAGHARITAALDGVETYTTVGVMPRRPDHLEVLMTRPEMNPGELGYLHAVGTYADGTRREITEWVAWLSSSDSALIVPDLTGTKLYAGNPGRAVITALFDDLNASSTLQVQRDTP